MRKHIFTLMALAAALCACNKEQLFDVEQIEEFASPLIFTATMDGIPGSKATLSGMTPSWEVGDQISINGFSYEANAAGTSTTFSMVGGGPAHEIRPKYVSSTDTGSYQNQPASNLVDDGGIDTRWIADKTQRHEGVWNIVVSTGSNTLLKTIKLWNADNSSFPNRRWKRIQLYGRSKTSDAWEIIGSYNNLNLAKNNKGFAGEIEVNSSSAYTFYKIDVLENEGDSYMQMSDMKFVVDPGIPYCAYFPASLFDGFTAALPSAISETWTEGQFNMPMYAQGSTPDLEFKNLCGVLKISVKKEHFESVKSIRVSSSDKATSGSFTVTNNTAVLTSPNAIANTVTVTYTDAVTTTDAGTVFYVAIPAQNYTKLKIELSSDGVNFTKSMTTAKGKTITVARNNIYPITFTAPPAGALPGKFKVNSQGKLVYFSQGNLWYGASTESTNTWNFETNQYDRTTWWHDNHIGNFFFHKASEITRSYAYSYTYWNRSASDVLFTNSTATTPNPNLVVNGVKGKYRCLSKDEWEYLLDNHIHVLGGTPVQSLSKAAYFFAPVDYEGDLESLKADIKDSEKIKEKGIVVLVVAGYRKGGGESYYYPDKCGFYWTSTATTSALDRAYALFFTSPSGDISVYDTDGIHLRKYAHCIRLVVDCE